MTDLFGKSRRLAFEKWQTGTNRQGCGLDERYDLSYECQWQKHAQENLDYKHISLFCSLADWACNITDLLSDTRYDKYDFDNPAHRVILARYYTRTMMVIAEHLADLQQIVKALPEKQNSSPRERISPPCDKNWVEDLHCFVNNVCKHKAEKNHIHSCNHHLPLHFDDMSNLCQFRNPINLSNVKPEKPNAIQYPKLELLVEHVLIAYTQVNSIVMKNEADFRKICDEYDDPSFIWAQ
jgi:hypothetical protein